MHFSRSTNIELRRRVAMSKSPESNKIVNDNLTNKLLNNNKEEKERLFLTFIKVKKNKAVISFAKPLKLDISQAFFVKRYESKESNRIPSSKSVVLEIVVKK